MCWTYCDKLVLLSTADQAREEKLSIFIPEDKLNISVGIKVTLSLDPNKTEPLFNALPPQQLPGSDSVAIISWDQIYTTYAQQIVVTEVREYLSQYSIAQIASSMEKVNGDLRQRLGDRITERTPFNVRYVGVTDVSYPKIITDAQEAAAERRERIQQEEAQREITRVTLERQLEEAQLQRKIEIERAETEAFAQRIQREVVDDKVLALRKLENERAWIARWNGQVPQYYLGSQSNMLFQIPGQLAPRPPAAAAANPAQPARPAQPQ